MAYTWRYPGVTTKLHRGSNIATALREARSELLVTTFKINMNLSPRFYLPYKYSNQATQPVRASKTVENITTSSVRELEPQFSDKQHTNASGTIAFV
jgi:hypothetical protein